MERRAENARHAGLDPASIAKRTLRLIDDGLRVEPAMTVKGGCHAGLDPASTAKRTLRMIDDGLRVEPAMTAG